MLGKGLYSQGGNPLPQALSGDSGLFPHGLYVGRATSNRREAWADVCRAPGLNWEKVKSMENTYTIRLSPQPVWATSFCCPPIAPVPRGQTMEPFAHPAGLPLGIQA